MDEKRDGDTAVESSGRVEYLDEDRVVPEIERELQRVESTALHVTELITAAYDRLATVLASERDEPERLGRAHVTCESDVGKRLQGMGDNLDRQVERLRELIDRIAI